MNMDMAISLLRQGREIDSAFACIVLAFKDQLYTDLYALCRNHADAEELVQRSFVEAFLCFDRFEGGASELYDWLKGIGRNKWLMMVRGRYRERACLERMNACCRMSAEGPELAAVRKAREAAVWAALGRMDLAEQVVAVLHLMERLPYALIARKLGLPLSRVKAIGTRAKHLIRLQLVVEPVPQLVETDEEVEWTE